MAKTVTKKDLASPIVQGSDPDYRPISLINHHRPPFSRNSIISMLEDPRVNFALELIKGPIHCFTKFFSEEESKNPSLQEFITSDKSDCRFPYVVKAESEDVESFILKTIKRFWSTGAVKALTAIEFGYSGSEVLYSYDDKGFITYTGLRNFYNKNIEVVTQKAAIIGILVKNLSTSDTYLGIPKCFWHLNAREKHEYYGQSKLFGAYPAWYETWAEGGARDIRRIWYYRNSFDGGILRYPMQKYTNEQGQEVYGRDIAIELLAKKRSGGYLLFPNRKVNNEYEWEYEPPSANAAPTGMLEYVNTLGDEVLEGIGIPPEIIQGGAGGLGSSSGRSIPMDAYVSTLRKSIDFLLLDFQTQILHYLLALNFRRNVEYSIEPMVPMLDPAQMAPDNPNASNEAPGASNAKPKKPAAPSPSKNDSGKAPQ